MKPLPIGIQCFADLRKGGYVYVDKTKEIHRMVSVGKHYFLSRPRRFGKSLLVSALEDIFKGNKKLFEGLYIYDKIDWEQHPVIKIDWSKIKRGSAQELEVDLSDYLNQMAEGYEISLKRSFASSKFDELIISLREKAGKKVVILIDEYDMPILDALQKPDVLGGIRDFLQDFYKIIKANDENLRFVFLTGISKFSKVSIFSGLNNLDDITLDREFSTICGYTQNELVSYFSEHIADFARSENLSESQMIETIRHWYNGFSWDGQNFLYNPYSTLVLFKKKIFANYWFVSGMPTFLVEMLHKRNDVKLLFEPSQIQMSGFDSYEPATIETKVFLFQSGYLTVKNVCKGRFGEELTYTLDVPNMEVRQALMMHLLSAYTAFPQSGATLMRRKMQEQLFDGDITNFERAVKELFAGIPYQLHIPREAYYHSMLLLWLNMLGFEVMGEIPTDKGRIDAVWTFEDRVVIAEIKFSSKGTCDRLLTEAFKQIKDNQYYERYADGNKRITFLAVAFAGKKIACEMEDLVVNGG